MNIRNLQEANDALRPYVPLVRQLTGTDTTLERIRPLMQLLGNPQGKLKTIHIAGTSGKTSTAYYMAALLAAGNKKVGLTVSPHVDSITERVQIAGQALPEEVFCQELGEFLEIIEQAPLKPSYFELLYAFAIWVFERQKMDYAVVETGLGGLHDATNIATRADKVCIITDLGLDHTDILGNTLDKIAAQKIGIVHEHNTVFMYDQAPEAMRVIEEWVVAEQATLNVTSEKAEQERYEDTKTTMPSYQLRNWLLARKVYLYLEKRDNLQHLASQELEKTQKMQVPGRMEIRQVADKTVVMDGAHNAQKMTSFISSFQQLYPDNRPAVLVALKEGKDYQAVVSLIAKFASRIIVTNFNGTQDLQVRSMDAEHLAEAFKEFDQNTEVTSISEQHEAFEALLKAPEPVAVITGSFYLLGQIRNNEQSL